jgi:LacI family transcriptional regulator
MLTRNSARLVNSLLFIYAIVPDNDTEIRLYEIYHENCIFNNVKLSAVTIKDISRELHLSTSTVSRALRDSHEISIETKQLILDYARKINYKPNRNAQSLKEKKSHSIGVIVSEIANSFFSQVINGIESIASKNGYTVNISQSMESAERELMNLEYLTSSFIDGLIISVSTETKNHLYLKEVHEKGLPIVFVDRVIDEIETHKVIADNFKGAYKATKHLINKGYSKIALVSNHAGLSIAKERLDGYKAALLDAKIPIKENMIVFCDHGGMLYNEVESAMNSLMRLRTKPDAIFAGSDKITTGCMRFMKNKKIRIPEDLALIGFSNNDLTELLSPPLSVIKQPAFDMGEAAMTLLLSMMESKRPQQKFETRIQSTELLIRKST